MTPEQAATRYHWVKYRPKDLTIELYLDHFVLSGLRTCEAKFVLEHLLWQKPKRAVGGRNPWFLDFGEYIHYCLEIFYDSFKRFKKPPIIEDWHKLCKAKWDEMKMDEYANSPFKADVDKYEGLEGWKGVAGLLIEYYAYYMDLRVRVVDTEITFGHDKEVFIGKWMAPYKVELVQGKLKRLGKPKLIEVPLFVECYLTGRIDLLVDNGYAIGPVDHKTTAKFDGYEHKDFNPHDGITGYILAVNSILERYRKAGLTNFPVSTCGWIYHISSSRPSVPRDKTKKPQSRFKVTPIGKTLTSLEDYKVRNLTTFKTIAELLFNDRIPQWNTGVCHNLYFRDCEYVPLHEQPSNEWVNILKQNYEIVSPWDTREHSNKQDASTLYGPNTKGDRESTVSTEETISTTTTEPSQKKS